MSEQVILARLAGIELGTAARALFEARVAFHDLNRPGFEEQAAKLHGEVLDLMRQCSGIDWNESHD